MASEEGPGDRRNHHIDLLTLVSVVVTVISIIVSLISLIAML
jgi:hypothetical protein